MYLIIIFSKNRINNKQFQFLRGLEIYLSSRSMKYLSNLILNSFFLFILFLLLCFLLLQANLGGLIIRTMIKIDNWFPFDKSNYDFYHLLSSIFILKHFEEIKINALFLIHITSWLTSSFFLIALTVLPNTKKNSDDAKM